MKNFKAIYFDLNGTLVEIWTDENREDVYRTTANLLQTFGVNIRTDKFREEFFAINKRQRDDRHVDHPEFDVLGIFRELIAKYGNADVKRLTSLKKTALTVFLAQTFRSASMLSLNTYPCVHRVLDTLKKDYRLAAVSDAQAVWARTEMTRVKLDGYFEEIVISSELGERKPAPIMFQTALKTMNLNARDVIFVGNDMYRDVYGAGKQGMKTVFFKSNQGDHEYHGLDADYIICNFEELLNAVAFLEDKAAHTNEQP